MLKKFMIIFGLSGLVICLGLSSAQAKKKKYNPRYTSMVEVKHKKQKHFDIDRDGYLNRYEFALFNTHRRFGYPLVSKKKMQPYDFNSNLMLEPFEQQMYLKDKKNGTLRKRSKKDKKKDKIIVNPRKPLYQI